MLQKIIDNFEKECEKNPDDMMKRIICNHVAEKLRNASEKVLKNISDGELTLSGAIDKMRDEARKQKTGNCAVLSDEQGFAIVDEYFGIDADSQLSEQKPVSLFDMI